MLYPRISLTATRPVPATTRAQLFATIWTRAPSHDTGDCEDNGCPSIPELVDCNDTNECTIDTCDSIDGCVNTADTGAFCDDDAVCTGPDFCSAAGLCVGDPIFNCCLDDSECSQDLCDQAACNLQTNRCEEDPVECTPEEPQCQVSACDNNDGLCADANFEDGTPCNDGDGGTIDDQCTDGICSGMCPPPALCPCWTLAELDAIVPLGSVFTCQNDLEFGLSSRQTCTALNIPAGNCLFASPLGQASVTNFGNPSFLAYLCRYSIEDINRIRRITEEEAMSCSNQLMDYGAGVGGWTCF